MGKRELLILLAFVIVGGLVYQVTAPAADPSTNGRSWTDVFRNVRGEMFGSRSRLAISRDVKASVGPDVEVLDLGDLAGQITVVGEDREDIEAQVRVSLLGENEGEINTAAAQLVVKGEERDKALVLTLSHPDEWRLSSGRVAADVTMKAPRRLLVKLAGRGTVNLQQTAGASLEIARGTVNLRDLTGPVTGTFRDGSLDVAGATKVEVETRRVSVTLARIEGAIDVEAVDGQVRGAQLPGPIELDVRRVMVDLDEIAGKVSITGGDGRADLRRLSGPLTVDVERMAFAGVMRKAVEVDVEVADAPLEFTLPPGGVTLDAEATDGTIQAPDTLPKPEREGNTERLKAEVKGGGPAVRLRGVRTAVVVRTP